MNILVIGRAKTGTTVISKSIYSLIPDATYHLEPKTRDFFEDDAHDNRSNVVKIIYEHYNNTPDVRDEIVLSKLRMKFDKIVVIIRDPRDEAISRMYYLLHDLAEKGLSRALLNKWIEFLVEKENNPSLISMHDMINRLNSIFGMKRAINFKTNVEYSSWVRQHKDSIFIIKYEDFMQGDMEALSSYIGHDIKMVNDLGWLSYTKRSSNYNNWKRYYTEADVNILKPEYEEFLTRIGYDDWTLEPVPKLDPKEGSDYVKGITQMAYDKSRSENTVAAKISKGLTAFLNLMLNERATVYIKSVIKRIISKQDGYVDVSKGMAGYLDKAIKDCVTGWAIAESPEGVAKVKVTVNDKEEFFVNADIHRKDLKDRGLHPTGRCGFMLNLPLNRFLQEGDVVRARIVGANEDLYKSPHVVEGK